MDTIRTTLEIAENGTAIEIEGIINFPGIMHFASEISQNPNATADQLAKIAEMPFNGMIDRNISNHPNAPANLKCKMIERYYTYIAQGDE